MPANIGAELQQLPLQYMLAGPMTAAIEAQALAAETTLRFIEKVGLEPDGAGGLKVRTAEFTYNQSVPDPANPGAFLSQEAALSVPLLAIVPVPYIRVSDLNVMFEFKIRDIQSAQSSREGTTKFGFENETTTEAKISSGGGLLGFLGGPKVAGSVESKTTVSFNVSATYQSSNRSSTDRSATFKMTLNAVQDAIPEGLARVLAILSDAIQAPKK